MRICFILHGHRYCFTIPLLIDPLWRFHIHGPGPVENQGPSPEPWVTSEGKVADWAKDLQILASVDALSHQLSGDAQKVVRGALDEALGRVKAQLPEGAELHYAAR